MILRCSYEELAALRAGAHGVLGDEVGVPSSVIAPPETRARVEALIPQLVGDISVVTLSEARALEVGVSTILDFLRVEMETSVLAAHPADEQAVSAYFEFAHALLVAERLGDIVGEMAALIELVTGHPPTPETARSVDFPD